MFGVVATSTVDAVVKGVQSTKEEFKNGDSQKMYSKEEVLAILDGNLNFNTNTSDKKTISNRKEKLEI